MRIDVWSDVVCPWCYLGKRRLDDALEGLDGVDDIEVRWRAFQLDPSASTDPGPLRPVIDAKYGPGAFESMSARLSALGDDAGIDYRWDEVQRVSSRAALDLVAWVESTEGAEAAERLHDRLFRAYFTEGANIADPSSLVDWAVEVGVDRSVATEAVSSGAGRAAVDDDLLLAGQRGISGVPAFVFEDTWLVSGAQDVETLRSVIAQVREQLAADA
ncbi:MAG: DsbA family oxidoreductase [Actinomycetota bacterium]